MDDVSGSSVGSSLWHLHLRDEEDSHSQSEDTGGTVVGALRSCGTGRGGGRPAVGRGRASGRARSCAEPPLQKPVVLKTEEELLLEHCGDLALMESDEEVAPAPEETLGISSQLPEVKNHYLKVKPNYAHPGILEYRVTISPYIKGVKLRRSLLGTEESKEVLGGIKYFDGKVLILPFFLPHDMTFETSLKEDQGTLYEVSVTFKKIRPITECAEFLFDLLRLSMRWLNYKEIDGIFCDGSMRKALDEHRMEVRPGISLTSEIKHGGMIVKVETRNLFVGQDTVLDYLQKLEGEPSELKSKFEKLILNMKVITSYDNKSYKIDQVVWDLTPETKFSRSGEVISFKDYVERNHGVTITNADPPMLISIAKRKDEMGDRYVALIPEYCHITGLTDGLKENEKLMADVLETEKLFNAQNVTTFFDRISGDEYVNRFFDIWGLHLDRDEQ